MINQKCLQWLRKKVEKNGSTPGAVTWYITPPLALFWSHLQRWSCICIKEVPFLCPKKGVSSCWHENCSTEETFWLLNFFQCRFFLVCNITEIIECPYNTFWVPSLRVDLNWLKFKIVWAEYPTMHKFSLTHADDEIIHSSVDPDNECQTLVWAGCLLYRLDKWLFLASNFEYAYC